MSEFTQLQEAYEKTLNALKENLATLRTGRAIPSLIENLPIEAYGSTAELKTLATISTPESQQLLIVPFDPGVLQAIEQGIAKSNLGLAPVVEGQQVRITIPPLTEEKRQLLVKEVGRFSEEARVALRKTREETLKKLKARQADGEISEDDLFQAQRQIQTLIDEYNTRIEEIASKKEQEVMTV